VLVVVGQRSVGHGIKKNKLRSFMLIAAEIRGERKAVEDSRERKIVRMNHSRTSPQLRLFQPHLVFLCSLTGAALVGLYLLRYEHVRANVLDPGGTFQYFIPLMVPCFAFMIERVQHVRKANFLQHGVDFLVFGLAVGRVLGSVVMHISGHTLLLSYMLLSSRSKVVLIASILVLGQTLFLKYYMWGDFMTSNVGLVAGCVLALIVRWGSGRSSTRAKAGGLV
jgi:hypothetical protein